MHCGFLPLWLLTTMSDEEYQRLFEESRFEFGNYDPSQYKVMAIAGKFISLAMFSPIVFIFGLSYLDQ